MPIENPDQSRDATGPAEKTISTDKRPASRTVTQETGTGVPGLTKAHRPRKVLPEALSLARLRGKVELTVQNLESLFHFTIVLSGMIAFVRVRFAERILATPAEIAAEFREDLLRLRAIVQDAIISRELWLRSRHGTWRFFRVTAEGLIEIGRDGRVCPDKGGTVAAL
jgi:hypothetical protein